MIFSVLANEFFPNQLAYNVGISMSAIIIISSIPICYFDSRLALRYEVKQNQESFKKQIDLKDKELNLKDTELALKDKELELEKAKLKLVESNNNTLEDDDTGIKIVCDVCGHENEALASICSYCGSNLT